MAVSIALVCVLGYLLGGINGAILLSKLVEKDDVRRHGSGNAGFTNFFRNYGKRTSLLVILIDAARRRLPAFWAAWPPHWATISPPFWASGGARASSADLQPLWSRTGG